MTEKTAGLVERLELIGIPPGTYEVKPADGLRRVIARRTTESARDIPHFPLVMRIEIDRLLAAREAFNVGAAAQKVSLNDAFIKASALALMAAPQANASYMPEGLIYHHGADIAVAVAIPGGLVTPIVRGAERKSIVEISREMRDLAARARARRLAPDEYQGGTFSISNLGMFGISSFGSILNPPHGCILSVGAGETQAVGRGGRLEPATVINVTLTCDHRIVDGATGAGWLQIFKRIVEAPEKIFA